MLYGINKIGVFGGHGDGANAIPSQYAITPELKAYREGTAMHQLADALAELPGITNLRPGPEDIHWSKRAQIAADAGVDLDVELHTNWSVNSEGQPNSGVFLVIVALYNPVHGVDEQKAMAEQLFKPLADSMGMKFEIRTRKGGGEWDYYSFINYANQKRIPWPMIVEHGYHADFAPDVAGNIAKVKSRYAEIVEIQEETEDKPTEEYRYMVHAGGYADKSVATGACASARLNGYPDAYVHQRNGVYYARCVMNDNIEYAMRNAEELKRRTGQETGIVILSK